MIARFFLALVLLVPAALVAQPEMPPIPLKSVWGFVPGSEFPGAKGSIDSQVDIDKAVGRLLFDFSAGGVYVGARADTEIPVGTGELRLRVRTASHQTIGLRLRDAKGQWHQNEFVYDRPGEWQPIRWDLAAFRSKLHWGGPKDGVLHFPVREIQLLINKSAAGAAAGVLEFEDPRMLR